MPLSVSVPPETNKLPSPKILPEKADTKPEPTFNSPAAVSSSVLLPKDTSAVEEPALLAPLLSNSFFI